MTPRVFGRFWNRALPLLLVTLGSVSGNSLAAPPTPPDGSAVLRVHGSNTVGAKLAPMLVAGLFEAKGLQSVRIAPAGKENEQRITALDERGRTVQALVAAHGTGTGFAGLKDGTADLAAASRPIKQSEAQSLAALGDMRSAGSEQVIAIDGLAVIVHPDNPVQSLSVEQVAHLFAGQIANWRELGGADVAVELHARDDQSGTYDTFKELVLNSQGQALATSAVRYESNDALSQAVSRRSGAIGFVGLASVGKSKALAITDGDSQPMPPTTALVATEDYPLSRRLFLYADPQKQSKWTREFLTFVHSPAGQAIVEKSGYVAQAIAPIRLPLQTTMPEAYQQLAKEAQRLTVNFRFAEGSAQLDNKAQRDVQRLIDYLNSHDKQMNAAVLVGFGDARNDPARTALLSKLRAMAVRRELARGGILVKEINGLGDQLPVASNSEAGRIKNRRVEVWVY
ncbi:substrate-binding domain-containing protein [Stutzerimonas kunmingensis]|uniref:substrate-binding domain-containing protein n=1 Tax=Stutzerimonas kunmingensis TaxID=1211807 RepID=UPI0008EF4DF7|nr:substrate-binding domain-containing protein [Stutzerimonas kunmingensis]MCQ2041099.1 substrate-binding domain-containing protein [Stutzerimonas kunmingensis]SFJ20185.1 phosphate transport system substrate-binding protein [Stutzerimonas kunmingensis]